MSAFRLFVEEFLWELSRFYFVEEISKKMAFRVKDKVCVTACADSILLRYA